MKTKLFFATFLFFTTLLSAQKKYVIGNVKNEVQDNIPQTYIYNPRTEELILTDISGNFIISAISTDELRVIKNGYERIALTISDKDFQKPVDVILSKLPIDIEEVQIAFHATGNLKKDLAYFKTSAKKEKLNTEMSNYMKTPMNEVAPQNTIPSAFAPRNPNEGQIPLLSIGNGGSGGLLGLLGSAIVGKKTNSPPPNYAEIQDFYRRVKDVVDVNYFKAYGMSDYDFEIFLAYVDENNNLAKRFHKNFNKSAIESELKLALADYLKSHKINS